MSRLAAALLPEPPLRILRTLWHRSQALDPPRPAAALAFAALGSVSRLYFFPAEDSKMPEML
jgi:hypothetical protein